MRRLILAVVVFASACGNAAAPSAKTPANPPPSIAAASPESATSPTPSPAPSLLTQEQAAAAYAKAAKIYNKAIKAAYAKYGKRQTLKSQKKYWAVIAKADDAWIEALKAIAFPADVQPDVDKLRKADIVAQRAALAASKAKTWARLRKLAAAAIKKDEKAVDLAAIVRDELGLPPNAF